MREDRVIVFLDDDPNRAALQFQRMSPENQKRTFWVQTVVETIDMLKDYRERLEVVMLDHDLGGEHYVHTAREDCGMEVVRWLEHQPTELYSHVRFIVHSWNIPAARRMKQRLQDKGYNVVQTPFGS